jgi:hypothetical protein
MTNLVCTTARRRADAEAAGVNGIDSVEVVTADQRRLELHFLMPLPGQLGGPASPILGVENVRIDGGTRVLGVAVTAVAANADVLIVDVDRAGDFSTYTVRIVAAAGSDAPPTGFDPLLSSSAFSFKAGCPNAFDCEDPEPAGAPRQPSPVIDYLARDFESFNRLLSDRAALVNPGWTDRNPADPGVALLELLADLGDRLSYEHDSIATEAYLGTARSRISLRRHVRMLDDSIDDGANATAWIAIELPPGSALNGTTLPAGTVVLSGPRGGPATIQPDAVEAELRAGAIAFETADALGLAAVRNRLRIHTYSDTDCVLMTGATSATLVRPVGLVLGPGDRLLLEEERSPLTGLAADADPAKRHVVTVTQARGTVDPVANTPIIEVAWDRSEALPFDLIVSARVTEGGPPEEVAVARGNLVRAVHGMTGVLEDRLTVPAEPVAGGDVAPRPYRPRLDITDLAMTAGDDEKLIADIALDDGDGEFAWTPARDLFGTSGDDQRFVVEFEHGHQPHLRFGDNRFGRQPAAGTEFRVRVRRGTGPGGNVGTDALARIVTSQTGALSRVRNPMPATGGRAPEERATILTRAPVAFRTQQRAVTAAEWVEIAERDDRVQRAAATMRWTGSWWTAFVAIDRVGGGSIFVDPQFTVELGDRLDRFRMTGIDVELRDPHFVPLDVELLLHLEAGYFRRDVARAARFALAPGPHADGSVGLFHPDRFTFGQPLYLSQVHAELARIPGIRCADIVACHPMGIAATDELASGVVRVGAGEVIRLDDDRNRPEDGRLRIEVEGGL